MLSDFFHGSKDPSVNIFLRLTDPDFGMPDVFYMMDEIGKVQVLRRFQKREEDTPYCGTFEILHKTERGNRFCLIMRRRPDERPVPEEFQMLSEDAQDVYIVAEYYPGVMSRIYLRGLSEETVQSITDEYVKKVLRRKKRKKLPFTK